MNNIILIGMPSCGKSTVGVLLAKNLGYGFIDTDILIQEKTKKRLCKIIAEGGADSFLNIENDVLASVEAEGCVIATGGSAIYGKEAMEHLRSIGKVIYLKISFEALSQRLGDYVHRGVVIRNGCTLEDMYNERSPLYEKYADAVIDEALVDYSLSATVEEAIKVCESIITNK